MNEEQRLKAAILAIGGERREQGSGIINNPRKLATAALAAADQADREAGIHRVRVDDETVERVARAIGERLGFDIVSPNTARAVLAALTGEQP